MKNYVNSERGGDRPAEGTFNAGPFRRPEVSEGSHDFAGLLRAERPATRIGREVIFEGGECVRLSLFQYALVKLGVKRTVARAARKGA